MAPRRSTRSATAHSTQESEKIHPKRSASPSTEPKHAAKRAKVADNDVTPEGSEEAKQEEKPDGKDEEMVSESAVKDEEIKEGGEEGGATTGVEATAGQRPSAGFLASMGTEKETERHHGLLESGQIFFLYRPKVELEEAHSVVDVAHFHVLLLPNPPHNTSDVNSNPHRLIVIGRKHLPEPRKTGRPDVFWGEVIQVGDDLAQLKDSLGSYKYQTKTLGERRVAAARVAAIGHYVLNSSAHNPAPRESKNASAVYKTYLAYVLSTPHKLGEVQHDLNIHQEGAFHLQVKNPSAPSSGNVRTLPADKRAKYPDSLKHLFTTKFVPANPPSLLDYPGAELLFIPSKRAVEEDVDEEVSKSGLEAPIREEQDIDAEVVKEGLHAVVKEEEENEQWEFGGPDADSAKAALAELGLMETKPSLVALEGHWS